MEHRHLTTPSRPRAPEQARLDFNPPAVHPHTLRSEPQHQLLNELGARATRARAIIDRLRLGPATSAEIAQVGGLRYHARLLELRTAGYVIASRRGGDGLWEYQLITGPAK